MQHVQLDMKSENKYIDVVDKPKKKCFWNQSKWFQIYAEKNKSKNFRIAGRSLENSSEKLFVT